MRCHAFNFELIALNCEACVSGFLGGSFFIDNIFANYNFTLTGPVTRGRFTTFRSGLDAAAFISRGYTFIIGCYFYSERLIFIYYSA